ncbi:hypothetical protein [Tautonia rosea]|uniref:hypothetical protein n=1 Tax=Tautonia rosea TaxID=2728037 RepID=UPI0014732CF4|nr:hypothetical protein [Tautonia rosea]
MMSRPFLQSIATLLLLTYGWLPTLGPFVHELIHDGGHSTCSSDGSEIPSSPPLDAESNCPVCEFSGQAQLDLLHQGVSLGFQVHSFSIVSAPLSIRTPYFKTGEPRAPPGTSC